MTELPDAHGHRGSCKVCLLRFDNESDKGDHEHFGRDEVRYLLTTPGRLVDDF